MSLQQVRNDAWHGEWTALHTADLIALILRQGERGRRAAIRLTMEIPDLSRLATRGVVELVRGRGLPAAGATALVAAFELGRRAAEGQRATARPLLCSRDVFEHWRVRAQAEPVEIFGVTLVDTRNRCIRDVIVSRGTLTASLVHPREAFVPAIRERAAHVLLVHNHPSGDSRPSGEDVELTRRLVAAGRLLGIPVLDHVVIGAAEYFSFADAGLIQDEPSERVSESESSPSPAGGSEVASPSSPASDR